MIGQVQAHPEWRLIVELLSTRDYGTTVSHEELVALTGLRYPSARYFSHVRKARRHLHEDWSRELESVARVGYRLTNPKDFTGRLRREVVIGGRHFSTARRIGLAAPQHLLTAEENVRNVNALAHLGALESHRRRMLTETRPALPATQKPDTPKLLSE